MSSLPAVLLHSTTCTGALRPLNGSLRAMEERVPWMQFRQHSRGPSSL